MTTPPHIVSITPTPSNVVPLPGLNKADRKRSKERWTDPVLEQGYSIVPTLLMWGQAKLGLTPEEMNVLLQLVSHWWFADQDPHPAKDTIATRMGRDSRTVQRYLTRLEKKGFISRVQRYRANKGQDANGYDLTGLVLKLSAIAPEFKKVAEQNKLRRKRVEKSAG